MRAALALWTVLWSLNQAIIGFLSAGIHYIASWLLLSVPFWRFNNVRLLFIPRRRIISLLVLLLILLLILLVLLELGLTFLLFLLRFRQHSQIMLCVLLKVFSRNPVVRQLRIARKLIVFIDNLLRRAANLAFWARAVEDAVDDIAYGTVTVRLITRT